MIEIMFFFSILLWICKKFIRCFRTFIYGESMEELGIILFKSDKEYPYKKYKDFYVITGEDIIENIDEDEEGYIMKLRDDDTIRFVNISAKDAVSEIALNLMLLALNKTPKRKDLIEYKDAIEIAIECSKDNIILSLYNMAKKRIIVPEDNFIPIPITSTDNAEKLLSLKDKLNNPIELLKSGDAIEGVFLRKKFYYQTAFSSVNIPKESVGQLNINYGAYGELDRELTEYLFIGNKDSNIITTRVKTPFFMFYTVESGYVVRTNNVIPNDVIEKIVRHTYEYLVNKSQLLLPETISLIPQINEYEDIAKQVSNLDVEFLVSDENIKQNAESQWLSSNIIFRISFIGGKIFVFDNIKGSIYVQSFDKKIISEKLPQLYEKFKEKDEIIIAHSPFVRVVW